MAAKTKSAKKKTANKLRLFMTILISVVAAILIAFLAAQRLGNLTISTIASDVKSYFLSFGAGDGYPYEISSSDVKNIKINNSNLYLLLENDTKVLTSTAKEIFTSEHRFADPVMKNNGSKVIIYDLSSGKYKVQTASGVMVEDELQQNIMSAAVGKKGNYAVGTYAKDAQSELKVFGNNKKEQFSYKFKDERIIDISLSNSGKYVAVAAVKATNGELSSKLYIFAINSGKTVSTFDYPATTIVKLDYVSGDRIVVVGNNLRSYIKGNKERQDDIKFNSDTIHNYVMAENGVSAMILSKYGSDSLSNLSIYSRRNGKLGEVAFDKEAKWLDCDGNFVAVLFDGVVKTYNKDGKHVGTITFDGEPVRVAVDGMKTYVLTTVGLKCFNTKGTTDERQSDNG